MSKSEEFRKALDVPIRNLSVDVLVREICHQPECFEAMYRLMSDETKCCVAGDMGMRETERNTSSLVYPAVR